MIGKWSDDFYPRTEKIYPGGWGQNAVQRLHCLVPIRQIRFCPHESGSFDSPDRTRFEVVQLEKECRSLGTFAIYHLLWVANVPVMPGSLDIVISVRFPIETYAGSRGMFVWC